MLLCCNMSRYRIATIHPATQTQTRIVSLSGSLVLLWHYQRHPSRKTGINTTTTTAHASSNNSRCAEVGGWSLGEQRKLCALKTCTNAAQSPNQPGNALRVLHEAIDANGEQQHSVVVVFVVVLEKMIGDW